MNTLPDGPIGVYDIELSCPLPPLAPIGDASSARVLARVHSRPVADLVVRIPRHGLDVAEVELALADVLPLAAHHTAAEGSRDDGEPVCLSRRREIALTGPSITVLIATRGRPAALLRCLDSIARLDYPRFDVVVVDNAPRTDDTQQAVWSWKLEHPTVPLRYLVEPVPGAALAHNRGLAGATGEWVARTDDDVVVDPQWLSAIAEAATSEPGVACVTGLILPAEVDTAAQKLLEQFGGYARGFERRCYDLDEHRPAEDGLFPFTVGRLGSGANMAFEAAKLRARGGFDIALGPGTTARGGEDLLALFQVIAEGHKLVYEPSALVWHWNRRDYPSLQRLVHDYGIGLAAYLMSAALRNPRLASTMLRRAAPGVRHVLSRASAKNRSKRADYPRELERLEMLGMLKGPPAYLASRWKQRGVAGNPIIAAPPPVTAGLQNGHEAR
jgi:glycosyltransferase involved in cell wall biosynthesis